MPRPTEKQAASPRPVKNRPCPALPRPAEIDKTCQQPATCRSNFHLDKSSLLILNQNYGMINVWTPHLSHTTPTQPNMHNGNGYYTVADMYHRVQSLLTSPKSPTATATCLHLLFDIISRGRVWVRGDYDSFIHSTIRTLH